MTMAELIETHVVVYLLTDKVLLNKIHINVYIYRYVINHMTVHVNVRDIH